MRITDDLFDLSAGSLGKLSLRKEVVELAPVVTEATQATAHLLDTRGHRLTVSLPVRPVFLFADPVRLEPVLTNFLANAAKYTDPGGDIRLTAEAGAGQVVLRVRDNGRGIAAVPFAAGVRPVLAGPRRGSTCRRARTRTGPGEGRVTLRGQRRGP